MMTVSQMMRCSTFSDGGEECSTVSPSRGGEPLLHADMPEFLERVKALGYKIKARHQWLKPDLLAGIIGERLVDPRGDGY